MRRIAIFGILIGLISPIYPNESFNKELEKGNIILKYTPTSIIDPILPRIEFGLSYFFSNRQCLQLKYGSKLDIYRPDDPFRFRGFKTALEYQFFFNNKIYIGLEIGYTKNKYTDSTILTSNDNQNEIVDKYYVIDNKIFIVPKFGFTFFLTHNLHLDLYAGIGVVHHIRSVYDLDSWDGYKDTNFYEWFGPTYNEINEEGPRLSFGLNINWRFKFTVANSGYI